MHHPSSIYYIELLYIIIYNNLNIDIRLHDATISKSKCNGDAPKRRRVIFQPASSVIVVVQFYQHIPFALFHLKLWQIVVTVT